MNDIGLPRVVAARVTVHGLAVTQRIVAVIGSAISATIVIDVLLSRGVVEGLPLVIAPFVGIGVLALLLLWRATVLTALVYLIGGAVLAVAVPLMGLAVDPLFDDPGPYLLNRVATAICLVGAVGGSALSGLAWSTGAFIVAQSSVMLGLALAGSTVGPGSGPVIVFSVSIVAYATLAISQRQSIRRMRPLRAAGREVRTIDDRQALERRAAVVLHDTVLADLTAIARTTGPLSDRMRLVLENHLRIVESSSVRCDTTTSVSDNPFSDALYQLVYEYQWSGVRVDVSGVETLNEHVSTDVRNAVVGAVRAALDNVVQHAATDRAELVVGVRDHRVTVLVVDDGVGFEPGAVPLDRLGLRASITGRIEQLDGSVRVWSGPDGTTVMMTVPLAEAPS